MTQKFVVILFAALLLCGCKLGNIVGGKTETNSAPTPTAPSPPSKESKIRELKDKAKDLWMLGTTTKLDPKAKIKGKIAITRRSTSGNYALEGFNDSSTDYDEIDLKDYGLSKDEVATNADEIDTLVQITCEQGKKIGVYKTTDYRSIDAFALDCKVSVVDYKNRSVFAQKSFTSKELDDNIKVTSGTTERLAYFPMAEIGKYLKTLRSGK